MKKIILVFAVFVAGFVSAQFITPAELKAEAVKSESSAQASLKSHL